MCQLHILLTRAAQIYLELHFCVELHTKKALLQCGLLTHICGVLFMWAYVLWAFVRLGFSHSVF